MSVFSSSNKPLRDDLRAVERELSRRGALLRFQGPLEYTYRQWHANGSRVARQALAVVVLVMLAVNTANEFLLLRPDARFLPLAHVIQWGIECPAVIAALLVHRSRRLQRLWDPALIVAGMVVAFGVEAQRVLQLSEGFDMPALFAPVAVVTGTICARLRFWLALPASLIFLAVWGATEAYYLGNAAATTNVIFVGVVALSGLLVGLYGQEYHSRRAWLQQEWNRVMSETDPMTSLPNRRALTRLGEIITAQARRDQQPIAMAVIDIDHFKRYNDKWGHERGDECIRRVGQTLSGQARRPQDVVGRIGGEEFVIIWYGRNPSTLYAAAEACRRAVSSLAISHPDGPEQVVTVSVGAVCLPASCEPDLESLYRAADSELYIAKRAGRDRCSVRLLSGADRTSTITLVSSSAP